jgi:3-deoxy-D-manno-octulosonate 8-phosphate phosphatase (KDO 8-P phosphatase)
MAAALQFAPATLLKAQGRGLGLKAAIFDVDGVLTDGRLYIDEAGERLKAFHVQDGQGLKLLMLGGIVPIVISGRDSAPLRRRIADLGLPHVRCGVQDKLSVADELLTTLGIDWADTAAMGDDWPDLPLLARAGFAVAPPDAHAEARAAAHHVTRAHGGEGAVRECCDLLLMAAGRYAALLDGHRGTLDAC